MQKAALIALAIGITTSTSVFAQDVEKLEALVENLCIGGQLHEELLGPMVKSAASFYKMDATELALGDLRSANPDATSGWGIFGDGEQFIISFARKTSSGRTSKSCSVATPGFDTRDIKAFIEEKYKSRKMVDEIQGSSSIAAYELDLVGYQNKMFLSIQAVNSPDPNLRMLSVGFYDVPNP